MPAKPATRVVNHRLVRKSSRLTCWLEDSRGCLRGRVWSGRLLRPFFFGLLLQMLQTLLDITKHLLVITDEKLRLQLLWYAMLFSFSFRHFGSFEVSVCFDVVFVIWDPRKAFRLNFLTKKPSSNGLIATDPKISLKNSSPSAMKLLAPITRQFRDSQIP